MAERLPADPPAALHKCCACNRGFSTDGDPKRNASWPDLITCPYCRFRQTLTMARTWHRPSKQIHFDGRAGGRPTKVRE